MNSNGLLLLLLSMCVEFELAITNTKFQLPDKFNGTVHGAMLSTVFFKIQYSFKNTDISAPVSFRTTGSLFSTQHFKSKTKTIMKTICDLLFADDCACGTLSK